jgi:hypothetical protein
MHPSRRRLILPSPWSSASWRRRSSGRRARREPTPEERARVETALCRLGHVRWDEIEFEDGV